MSKNFKGQPAVNFYLDDILVIGEKLEEYDNILQSMLQRLDKAGAVKELAFLGHTLFEKRLHPDASQVSAVADASPPVE